MASRLCFIVSENSIYEEKMISFDYYSGFAICQKQKSIKSLHENIKKEYVKSNILEISSKSTCDLGVKLSAFNLKKKFNGLYYTVETIFQASKKFENGGPFTDLLNKTSADAKKDVRLRESGNLVSFVFDGIEYPNEPKTLFYDWIYCNALYENFDLLKEVSNYNIFTDIEFNHNKSINCQARAVAICVGLYKKNLLECALNDINVFKKYVYKNNSSAHVQLKLF